MPITSNPLLQKKFTASDPTKPEDPVMITTDTNFYSNLYFMAEEEGFEPSVQVSSHGHLANDWFQPLTHSSTATLIYPIVLNIQYL